ncbi:MAG: acetate/propionate family kinase, partial [Acidobacteriaceae bacterium]|nr:acetate/propionate family kinase [Acidobacteriaceae bacterium]
FQVVDQSEGGKRFGTSLVSGGYDNIGKEGGTFSLYEGKRVKTQTAVQANDYGHAAELLFKWLPENHFDQIDRIAHRVVHGADLFTGPVRIGDKVVEQIEGLADLAPLHNEPALSVIRGARSHWGDLENIAVFDTVFHRTVPEVAATYALPFEIANRHKIRRYGFHGVSHQYMTLRYCEVSNGALEQLKLITLHLEGGSSAAAIRYGKSIDTSMGFTPLEGLVMGTRCGDLDPAIVTYLMAKEKLDSAGIENVLNKESGLKGISGVSADTRQLRGNLDDPRVKLALEVFSYRVRKYLGAYLAALNGADAIVFGGGIGENTPEIREWICKDLDWLGIDLDCARNAKVIDREDTISTERSRVKLWVIPTQENLMIAREAARL